MKFHQISCELTFHRAENMQFFTRPIKSVTMATYVCRPHVIKEKGKRASCPHLEVLVEISGSRQKMSPARTNN